MAQHRAAAFIEGAQRLLGLLRPVDARDKTADAGQHVLAAAHHLGIEPSHRGAVAGTPRRSNIAWAARQKSSAKSLSRS